MQWKYPSDNEPPCLKTKNRASQICACPSRISTLPRAVTLPWCNLSCDLFMSQNKTAPSGISTSGAMLHSFRLRTSSYLSWPFMIVCLSYLLIVSVFICRHSHFCLLECGVLTEYYDSFALLSRGKVTFLNL